MITGIREISSEVLLLRESENHRIWDEASGFPVD